MVGHFPFAKQRIRIRTMLGNLDPLETLFLIVFAFSGAVQLVSGVRPGSIDASMPPAFRTVWMWIFLIGSVVALAGCLWLGNRVNGLTFEHIGLWWVGLALVVYGGAQIYAATKTEMPASGAILAGPLTITLGVAFIWKAVKIKQTLNGFKI